MSNHDFDVGIIGGGPAGATMAAYLARAGVSCVIFEREVFPREHVGESLVPATTRVFREIGFLDQMEGLGFPRKYGAVWSADTDAPQYDHDWEGLSPDCEAAIRFDEREQEGVQKNYTWHVDRGKFDLAYLQHANALGAQVYSGVRIEHIDLSAEDHAAVRYRVGRKDVATSCRMIVDASGRKTQLGNQLDLRVRDDVFDQYALHTWFEGFDRGDEKSDYIWIHFLPVTNTWVWQIPITDDITSIGVVTQRRHFKAARADHDAFFWDCVASRPGLEERLRAANQLRPLKAEGDYSYSMKQIVGDRWALIGDAARFVDPIFSSGVSIACSSARFLSWDLIAALESDDLRAKSFDDYATTMRHGTRNWYEFISIYYRLNVLFTMFINDPRYRQDILKLLQGDVYDEAEPPVLEEMRNMVGEVERNPQHVWHRLLGDLTANAMRPQF